MTLITLLRDGAEAASDQQLVVTPDRTITYREALERSLALARGLQERAVDRFACVVADAADLIPLLCASSAVASEACVYPVGIDEAVIDEYRGTFDHPVVVTDRSLESGSAVSIKDLAVDRGTLPPTPSRAPTLILTTGTTGRQRGVRHDWGRLIRAMRHADPRPGTRWLLAYNLNQFAGTQILLHTLTSRATLVAPASNQPRDALVAMRQLGVTNVSATPTFWRFVSALLDDESAKGMPLRQITIGGEAVPARLLESLRNLFPQARISQIYGATEFGMVSSVGDGRNGLPASVLERGTDVDVQVRIVDGELQVRSRVGMIGYYGEPDVGDEWRSTGDLVRLEGDRIHFVGRASETINVGGVKVHPLPIEERAAAVDGVRLVRAYGRPNPMTGQIVVLDVVPQPGVDLQQLEREVRVACDALLPAARPRRIRFVDELEVRGHKIVRGSRTI